MGRAVLDLFKQNGYKTISIDRVANDQADQNIIVLQDTLKEQGAHVLEALASCQTVPGELLSNKAVQCRDCRVHSLVLKFWIILSIGICNVEFEF